MSVKKKATKKPSAKQLASRKKFADAAKARAKTAKKTGAKKWTKKPDGTRTRTAAAKKARKAKNTVEGYYPNPLTFMVCVSKSANGQKYPIVAMTPGGGYQAAVGLSRKFKPMAFETLEAAGNIAKKVASFAPHLWVSVEYYKSPK